MTAPDPTQEVIDVLVDLLDFATSTITFIANDLVPLAPSLLEGLALGEELIAEPIVEAIEQAACG
jgi:hypothetical protein